MNTLLSLYFLGRREKGSYWHGYHEDTTDRPELLVCESNYSLWDVRTKWDFSLLTLFIKPLIPSTSPLPLYLLYFNIRDILFSFQVSWLRKRNDSVQLLTVGNTTYSSDSRLGLHFRYGFSPTIYFNISCRVSVFVDFSHVPPVRILYLYIQVFGFPLDIRTTGGWGLVKWTNETREITSASCQHIPPKLEFFTWE